MSIQRKKILKAFWLILAGYLLFCRSSLAQEEKFFEIKARQFNYTPNIIRVKKGELLRIRLISEDVTHGMFLDGYGINTSAHPGQEGSLKFVANKAGRFSFRCSVTCGEFHPYMIGYLVVEDNIRYLGYVFLTLLIGLLSVLANIFKKPRSAELQETDLKEGAHAQG